MLHHPADAGDLGDIGDGLQFIAQEPVLDASELGEVVLPRAVDQRILVNPTDPGRIGTERGHRPLGQATLHLAEIFEHAAARPIEIGAILENDVDVAVAGERIAADGARARH